MLSESIQWVLMSVCLSVNVLLSVYKKTCNRSGKLKHIIAKQLGTFSLCISSDQKKYV